jgi:hypothetical protein
LEIDRIKIQPDNVKGQRKLQRRGHSGSQKPERQHP